MFRTVFYYLFVHFVQSVIGCLHYDSSLSCFPPQELPVQTFSPTICVGDDAHIALYTHITSIHRMFTRTILVVSTLISCFLPGNVV